jgi:hypothetical protein
MYIHTESRLIFLAHPRTGSRSVAKGVESLGFIQLGAHHDGPLDKPDLNFDRHTLFTTVRNHWDTISSWFFAALGQSEQAELTVGWVRQWFGRNPKYFRLPRLFWFLGEHPDVKILRYETLAEDYHNFLGIYNLGSTELPHIGRNQWRKYRTYHDIMTPDVRDFIGDVFADEIEELGYTYHGDLPGKNGEKASG